MAFSLIKAQDFRNFDSFSLEPSPGLNVLYGENGSGKTSFLEAIYLLGHGRSFRARTTGRVIRHDSENLAVFGKWISHTSREIALGIEKNRSEGQKVRVDGENCSSLAVVAQYLPIQLLNPDGYQLLDGGPKFRRQYLDWGMFHMEHRFNEVWKRVQRCLAQRNAALKDPSQRPYAKSWDLDLVKHSETIDDWRRVYIDKLKPKVREIWAELIDLPDITIKYERGWSEARSLAEILESNYISDIARGYTQFGLQRADLLLEIDNFQVQDVLSRGQQKILVTALRLAQGLLLKEETGKSCVYLLDDVASELDNHRRAAVFERLNRLNAQIFVTGIHQEDFGPFLEKFTGKRFAVKAGQLMPE